MEQRLHFKHLPARVHDSHYVQPRCLLHRCSDRPVGVCYYLISLTIIVLISQFMSRLAEIATIILCTCFPMMPRFAKLISDRYAHSKPSLPSSVVHVRRSKIFRVGNAQSSVGISSTCPKEEDMPWPKSPYQQLGEEESDWNWQKDVVRELGTKKSVDIEMATWDQVNAKSRVASMAEWCVNSDRGDVGDLGSVRH